jgi:hypothetical protein
MDVEEGIITITEIWAGTIRKYGTASRAVLTVASQVAAGERLGALGPKCSRSCRCPQTTAQ